MKEDSLNNGNLDCYKPQPSRGGIWSIIFLLFINAILIPIILIAYLEVGVIVIFLFLVIILPTGILFASVIYGYYTMNYRLETNELVLRWGFFKTKVPYKKIIRIEKPSERIKGGIRVGGVGLPGYLVGKFRLLIEGKFEKVSLYATNLEKLVLIQVEEQPSKYFGITPENVDRFLLKAKKRSSLKESSPIDTHQKLKGSEEEIKKSKKNSQIIFFFTLGLILINIIYFMIIYPFLPNIIPMHWGIDGTPDRYGSKSELVILLIIMLSIVLAITLLFYVFIIKRSELGKTKYGTYLMLLSLLISSVFFLILTMVFQSIL